MDDDGRRIDRAAEPGVPPGTGWPDDPASTATPVAGSATEVTRLAAGTALPELRARVSVCRACPRLVDWREQVARERRRQYADEIYWGRPVPGFGAEQPRILVLGLAPAAHGANRTGRMFTGDRSGDWLYAALFRAGLADRPVTRSAGDGLTLHGVYITAPVHCAPPANKPTPAEQHTCAPWLHRELQLLWPQLRAVVVLGAIGWANVWPALRAVGATVPVVRPRFGHGAEVVVDGRVVVGCYHVSQQNTFTGRLTEPMLDAVFERARRATDL